MLLLELGVGYNTPVIIRYPFEQLAQFKKNTTLVRVNLNEASVPQSLEQRSVTLESDLGKALEDVRKISLPDTK